MLSALPANTLRPRKISLRDGKNSCAISLDLIKKLDISMI
jgi:hypothetical protein